MQTGIPLVPASRASLSPVSGRQALMPIVSPRFRSSFLSGPRPWPIPEFLTRHWSAFLVRTAQLAGFGSIVSPSDLRLRCKSHLLFLPCRLCWARGRAGAPGLFLSAAGNEFHSKNRSAKFLCRAVYRKSSEIEMRDGAAKPACELSRTRREHKNPDGYENQGRCIRN
jgi:hypothetical protein